MNLPQRIVLASGVIVVAVMILFPPWLFVFDPPVEMFRKTTRPAGYHLLVTPHVPSDQTELMKVFNLGTSRLSLAFFSMAIDQQRLTVEIIGALLVITLLILFF